ncbi:MAG: TolC family protein [Burkholderiales bacterium]|nr:TolC family protein [Burkholderiales bacterium]
MRALGTMVALATAASLAGCALDSPPPREEMARDAAPNLSLPSAWTAAGDASPSAPDRWLARFDDPKLEALVAEALTYNPDLRVAAARVEQAAAYVKVAGATLYPQVNLLARGGGKMSGDSSGLQGAGLFANWELDLWGRVRAGRAAATDK